MQGAVGCRVLGDGAVLPGNWKWNTENEIRLPRPVCVQSMRFIYRNNQKFNVKSIFDMASTFADTPLAAHNPLSCLALPYQFLPLMLQCLVLFIALKSFIIK